MTGEPRPDPRLRLRLVFDKGEMIGPGKADLLEGIEATGSIAAAGRRMGMSYKRAWMLVEAMNAMFARPVVDSTRGGAQGGGARLTETGRDVLAAYRALEADARAGAGAQIARLTDLLAERPAGK